MSKYTTGELAKLCDVSVRTVQFYDTKDILKPTELSEGGRRLYTEADLEKLRTICLLKSLGLSLDSIKGILQSETPSKILMLLLDEQTKHIENEIREKTSQIKAIGLVKESLKNTTVIPVNSMTDIDSTGRCLRINLRKIKYQILYLLRQISLRRYYLRLVIFPPRW